MSPQGFFDLTIRSRGYSTNRYKTMLTGYYCKPTPLQIASYDLYVSNLIRTGDKKKFREVINSGISPNPCNEYGESLLHLVCRRGDAELLQIMLDAGATLQMADDMGRTPLHDCCWRAEPCFEMVEMILNHDSRMFHMTDSRGALPLSYVKNTEHWGEWRDFINAKKDTYWPKRDLAGLGEQRAPELAEIGPAARMIPDPANALDPNLAAMVATGRMTPREVRCLIPMDDGTFVESVSSSAEDASFSDSDSEYDSDEEEDIGALMSELPIVSFH